MIRHTCATVSSVMSQLFHVTTMTIVCSTRICTSGSLLWLWIPSTLQHQHDNASAPQDTIKHCR